MKTVADNSRYLVDLRRTKKIFVRRRMFILTFIYFTVINHLYKMVINLIYDLFLYGKYYRQIFNLNS